MSDASGIEYYDIKTSELSNAPLQMKHEIRCHQYRVIATSITPLKPKLTCTRGTKMRRKPSFSTGERPTICSPAGHPAGNSNCFGFGF